MGNKREGKVMFLVFKRSARSFDELVSARKTKVRKVETLEQARQLCREFNDNRTKAQVARGTKMEFTEIGGRG